MYWIEASLTRLERRLRELIEGDTARDGIPRKFHKLLIQELTLALKSNIQRVSGDLPDGMTRTAPDQYTLMLPVEQAQILLNHPRELDGLVYHLESIAAQLRIVFAAPPILSVVPDPLANVLRITTEYSHRGLRDSYTTEMGRSDGTKEPPAKQVPKAFLIVNGLTTYQLNEPVINIGRDPSNQLHLEDMRVSRMHAQLRLIQERFVIFDLDSLGGTYVNGIAVSSHTLNPGDVILLAGVPLVYGQETASQTGYTQELAIDPPSPEML